MLENQRDEATQGPLLIHISTDQVYDGSRAYWREDDACNPINVYGKTKREAELLIQVLAVLLLNGSRCLHYSHFASFQVCYCNLFYLYP